MNKKQTQCPECTTIYKVSVEQLTIAQGMVCCPKCFYSFNALSHLVEIPTAHNTSAALHAAALQHDYAHEANDHILARSYAQQHVLDIFDRKIEHSNIDLYTYLNNLNYFSSEPIHHLPTLKLSEKDLSTPPKPSLGYYMLWSAINLNLMGFLLFQVLWFNPHIVARSALLSQGFQFICSHINCESQAERYEKIDIDHLHLRSKANQSTEFQGALVNQDSKSIPLPHLLVTAQTEVGKVKYVFQPRDYLEQKYQGIERLPAQSPFKFSFEVPVTKKQLQEPYLEIIQP